MNKKILHLNFFFTSTYILFFITTEYLIVPIQNQFIQLGALTGTVVFLPHGLRIWAVLTAGIYILPGLALGHFLTAFYHTDYVPLSESFIRIGLTMVAIYIPYYLHKRKGISLQNILVIGGISSILNSILQTLYLQFAVINLNVSVLFTYLVGDILGALLLFYLIKYINYLIRIYKNS